MPVLDRHPSVLWTATRDGHTASAELTPVPIGIEVRFRRDESLLWSRIFPTPEEALQEAEQERRRLLREQWTQVGASMRPFNN